MLVRVQELMTGTKTAVLMMDNAESVEARAHALIEVEAGVRIQRAILHSWKTVPGLDANMKGTLVSFSSLNMTKPWNVLLQAHKDMLVSLLVSAWLRQEMAALLCAM